MPLRDAGEADVPMQKTRCAAGCLSKKAKANRDPAGDPPKPREPSRLAGLMGARILTLPD